MHNKQQPLSRAQGAIEYLLIIGAAILVVAIVVIAITSLLSQGQTQTTSGANEQNTALGGLTSLAYVTVSGSNYQKSDPIVTSLKSFWTLNDASTFNDSVGGINGTCPIACPTLVSGISGNALHFSSGNATPTTEQYVEIKNLPVKDESTYSIWFKANQSAPGYILGFSIYDFTADSFYHWRGNLQINSSNYLQWRIGSWNCPGYTEQTLNTLISKQPITLNEWHMATIVESYKPFKADFYLDGELQKSETNGKNCSNEKYIVWLGRRKADPSAESQNFIGEIDDFAIWDRQLTSDEIKELYTNAKK